MKNSKVSQFAQPQSHEIGKLARGAAKWAIILLFVRQGITIATTMVVSRFVSPADTGTVAMVTTFVSFIILFDTGLTWATVQNNELTKEHLDSLFWMGLLLGTILWLICAIAGPFLSEFYSNPQLKMVCLVMGVAPFLNSLTTQPSAYLKRKLQQKKTNAIDTAAITLSSILGVVLAILHYGYWAIIAQLVVMNAFRLIFLLAFSDYKPGPPKFSKSSFEMLKLGGLLAISNYVCYFQLYLGSILMGRFFGTENLGFYMKAFGLKTLPTMYATMVVTDVMVASLAAMQYDKERMGAAYRKALILTAFVGCPVSAMLYPLAPEAVRFLYGPQWDAAVPLLKWLAFPALMLPITTTTIWLFLAGGKGRAQLQMNLLLSSMTIVGFALALSFARTPITLVAVEALLFTLPFPIVNLIASHRATNLNLKSSLMSIFPILVISVVTATFVSVFGAWVSRVRLNWLIILGLKCGLGLIIYAVLTLRFIRPFPIAKIGSLFIGKV